MASLREHRVYIEGLGREFDPDEFLRNMAGYIGLGAGLEYAVGFRRYSSGCQPSRRPWRRRRAGPAAGGQPSLAGSPWLAFALPRPQ